MPAESSVLYQRGVYHPDGFAREAKYGITTLVTTDEGLKKYLENVIKQLKGERTLVTPLCRTCVGWSRIGAPVAT